MSFDMDWDELADAVNAGDTAHVTAAYKYALDERDHYRSERDEARRERDGWEDLAERRYALRSELEATLGIPHGPAESDSVEKAHARLRAILDERDAALAREARLREAAARWDACTCDVTAGVYAAGPVGDSVEAAREALAACDAIADALADPTATTWLADRERAAEERGAGWMRDAIRKTLHDRYHSAGAADWDDPTEVCRVNRERGGR